jgi:uncharacterized protein (TIGR03435 family)
LRRFAHYHFPGTLPLPLHHLQNLALKVASPHHNTRLPHVRRSFIAATMGLLIALCNSEGFFVTGLRVHGSTILPMIRTAVIFAFILSALPLAAQDQKQSSVDLPAFDAATIKPPDPHGLGLNGFSGKPGGRIFYGGEAKMLVEYAFNLQAYQISGGPGWLSSQRFEINAVASETSSTRNIKRGNAEPTAEQRLMLQRLLRDRFGLKYHMETKEGEVYILSRGAKEPQLKPAKDPKSDPRAIVFTYQGGIVNGQAMGNNTTTDYLAQRLGQYLQLPVLNQTGIAGAYDFDLPAVEPDNHDTQTAVLNVVDRLGLKIKRSRGPIQTLVIDHIEQPSEN